MRHSIVYVMASHREKKKNFLKTSAMMKCRGKKSFFYRENNNKRIFPDILSFICVSVRHERE